MYIIELVEQSKKDNRFKWKGNMRNKIYTDNVIKNSQKNERIFMLLISTNEYSELRTEGEEVVAVRSGTDQGNFLKNISGSRLSCFPIIRKIRPLLHTTDFQKSYRYPLKIFHILYKSISRFCYSAEASRRAWLPDRGMPFFRQECGN